MTHTSPGARFAAVFAAMLAAHQVADYWVQTSDQSRDKGRHGSPEDNAAGRRACLAHVTSYSATSAAAVIGANRALGLGSGWRGILAGQAISAVSHYWADRRYTLRGLAAALDRTIMPGKLAYYDGGGAPQLDQSWHIGWLALAALATAALGQRPRQRVRATTSGNGERP